MVVAAAAAQAGWKATPLAQRVALLKQAVATLGKDKVKILRGRAR
jgi:acyl-CoA reductase-like NAD-dependent aldehyde dehydrogenase